METGQLTADAPVGLETDVVVDELSSEEMPVAVASTRPFAFTRGPGRPAAGRRDAIYRRVLAAADALALAIALAAGVRLVDGVVLEPLAFLAFPALIVAVKALGLYDRDQHLIHKTTLDEVPKIFHISVLSALGVYFAAGVATVGEVTPFGVLVFATTLFLGMTALRALARQLARRLAPPERCVVVGDATLADELAIKIGTNAGTTVEFVGNLGECDGDPSAGSLEGIAEFLANHEIERVVLAPGADHRSDLLALVSEIKSVGVKMSVLPSISRAGGTSFELDRFAGVTLLGMRGFEFTRSSQLLTRSLDLVVSGTGLFVLAPLIACIAAAVKLTSPGPVFYRQTRVGRHGEHFEMLKFRTMLDNAHSMRAELEHLNEAEGGLFKIADDPRVTRVGRRLRSCSLDELPQLINVFRGEMSLVGPRPLVVEEDRLIQGWHRSRLALTPGMTGYWQVLGSTRIPLDEMVKLDFAYVQNWSVWNDIKILLRTLGLVAARRGI